MKDYMNDKRKAKWRKDLSHLFSLTASKYEASAGKKPQKQSIQYT